MSDHTIAHVTCLGCGCACDDIAVLVQRGRIADARNACELGRIWFGDGVVPAEVLVKGRTVSLDKALDEAAKLLRSAQRPLVYVAGDVSCETQRATVAIADRLRAAIDSLAATAAESVLAAQRRGRAGATLGEIRQHADLVVFWGVDPGAHYPRYIDRFSPASDGRTLIAVDIGDQRGPAAASARVTVAATDEVDALGAMRAAVQGRVASADQRFAGAVELARRMTTARYIAIVADAEPREGGQTADPARAEALVTLAQALNGPTRCALSTLRGGGNRSGADAVLTWQTGFPFAVDFAPRFPTYRPPPRGGAIALLAAAELDAALVVGAPASLPDAVARGAERVPSIAIGPRASAATFRPVVAVDTGVAGIHEGGSAFRMDDVPLPLRPSLNGGRSALDTVSALLGRLAP